MGKKGKKNKNKNEKKRSQVFHCVRSDTLCVNNRRNKSEEKKTKLLQWKTHALKKHVKKKLLQWKNILKKKKQKQKKKTKNNFSYNEKATRFRVLINLSNQDNSSNIRFTSWKFNN